MTDVYTNDHCVFAYCPNPDDCKPDGCANPRPLTPDEQGMIDAAWEKHKAARPTQPLTERLRNNAEDYTGELQCEAADRIDALEATQAELVEALRPFSSSLGLAATDAVRWPDNETIEHSGAAEEITWGDLRLARALLAKLEQQP